MTIPAGSRLGSFEVLDLLGAGGMGEVYRAKDVRLERTVALKILPEELFEERERAARFEREAKLLAALNHPNIASIYSFETVSDRHVLAMELAEGEGLNLKVARGALPLEEAIALARQIAEALEAAHEKGIIHRDLKPANVVVSDQGRVKLLDFGLAKAFESDGRGSQENSFSPTLTARATAAGVILGTAAYMAPEQARGKTVDTRADVWAFGAVLFEMLTGRRLFQGETVSDTLAAVLRDRVDFTELPPATPPSVRVLLERCLERDPKQRLQAIGESRIALERTLAGSAMAVGATPAASAASLVSAAAPPASRRALPWALGTALGALAGLTVAFLWTRWKIPAPAALTRVSVDLGADVSLVPTVGPNAVLSPDGTLLAFIALRPGGGTGQMWIRRLDQLQATVLSGTEGAREPFFAPDGQWIGFFADGKLKKISVSGGASVVLCEAPDARGASWAEDGTITFVPVSGDGGSLVRVPAAGGKPTALTKLEGGEVTHRWPQVLADGKAVLYTSHGSTSGGYEDANLVVQPLPSGPRKIVQRGGYHGIVTPSGHLVFVHEATLFAAPFDLGKLDVTGPPVPVVEGVSSTPQNGGSNFAFSKSGTLVYLAGKNAGVLAPIFWTDREGKTSPLRSTPSTWANPAFSPDGAKLAMDVTESGQTDVWVYEWARDTMSRFTFEPGEDSCPVWTPDGRRIAFSSTRADKSTANIYWQRADGTGEAQRLTEGKNRQLAGAFHPSGRFLAYMEADPKSGYDILVLPIDGDETSGFKPGKPIVFLSTPFLEVRPAFSPDGRWLAYMSNESGRMEVYVRPFPGPGGKWQVSSEGGGFPTWSRAGPELIFGGPEGTLLSAPYAVEADSFHAEKPRPVGDARYGVVFATRTFDLHPDGKRFAVLKATDSQSDVKRDKVVLVFNFFDELKRIARVGKS